LESGDRLDKRMTGSDVLSFKKLAEPIGRRLTGVRLNQTKITERLATSVDRIIGTATHSEGTVRGIVEKLNLHNRDEFTLFPVIGQPVVCTFPDELFGQVKEAI